MKFAMCLGLLVAAIVTVFPVFAQDTTQFDCDSANIAAFLETSAALIAEAQSKTDPKEAVDLLVPLANAISVRVASCSNLTFQGGKSEQPVIGPIVVPDGTYKLRLVTEGYFTAQMMIVSGECETRRGDSLFIISQGKASEGAEILFSASNGCELLIEVSNVTADWSLAFEHLTS